MISSEQAEQLGAECLSEYMTHCDLQSAQQAGDAIAKLICISSAILIGALGKEAALETLENIKDYLESRSVVVELIKQELH